MKNQSLENTYKFILYIYEGGDTFILFRLIIEIWKTNFRLQEKIASEDIRTLRKRRHHSLIRIDTIIAQNIFLV